MHSNRSHKRFVGVTGLVVLATGVFATWTGLRIGGDEAVRYIDDVGTVLAALAATILCLRAAARHSGRARLFWQLLAAASASWTFAEGTWGIYELALRRDVPVPSLADVGYLAAIPLAVAALLAHPALRGSGSRRARFLLDGLGTATALVFLSWALVLGPLWRNSDLSTLEGAVTLAYPFGDVIIVFFVALAIRGMVRGQRLGLWCLLGGLLVMALSDSTYAYLIGVKSYATGELVDTGWFAAYLLIALGAFASEKKEVVARRADELPTLGQLLAPFVPMMLALTVAAIEIDRGHHLDRAGWLMAFGLVATVLVRQALAALELAVLSRNRQTSMLDLLERVALGDPAPTEVRNGSAASSPLEGSPR